MMEYFKPLMSWLEEQNKAAKSAGNTSDVASSEFRGSVQLSREALSECEASWRRFETRGREVFTTVLLSLTCSHRPMAGLVGLVR